MAIIEKSQILTSSDQAGLQSFDGLARHRSNVFPVDLEQIIGHCSTYLAFGASPSQAGESFFTRPPSSFSFSSCVTLHWHLKKKKISMATNFTSTLDNVAIIIVSWW